MKDRSPWFELHLSVSQHRKTWALAGELSVERATALGYIVSLWCWALEQAQDGDLTRFTDRALADATGWRKAPGKLVAALVTAGYLDADRRLHEWQAYTGPLMKKRASDRERHRGSGGSNGRGSYGMTSENGGGSDGIPRALPMEASSSQTTDDSQQSTDDISSSSSAGARPRDAAGWYELATGRPPANDVMRQILEDLDVVHGAVCVGKVFEGAAAARDPWPYAKRIFDSCLTEGHEPRAKQGRGKHDASTHRGGRTGRDRTQPQQSGSGQEPVDAW